MSKSSGAGTAQSPSGLSARTAGAASTYRLVPLDLIDESPNQRRTHYDPQALGELADSIASEGLHQPIGVRGPLSGGRFQIVWGHRRARAAVLLRWTEIEARVFPPSYNPLLASVSENLQRADLTPLEEARAIQDFITMGESTSGIARLFRRSLHWVEERLSLLDLPEDLSAAVHDGRLPIRTALALRAVDHEPYRRELVAEVARSGASLGVVSTWTAHYAADRERYIRNRTTVDEMVQDRQAFVIYFACPGCRRDVPYPDTAAMRLCIKCHDALLSGLKERESDDAAHCG